MNIPKSPKFQAPSANVKAVADEVSTSHATGKTSFADVMDKISLDDIKPNKGSVVEILAAWGNRIIDSKHFTKNMVTIGSNPGNDVLLPYARGANHRLVSKKSGQIFVFVPGGCDASVITNTSKLSLKQIESAGGAKPVKDGLDIILKQEEMVKVNLSGEHIGVDQTCSTHNKTYDASFYRTFRSRTDKCSINHRTFPFDGGVFCYIRSK